MSASVLTSATVEEGEVGYFDKIKPIDGDASYDGDFAAWAFDQAKRLRALQSNDVDIANVAEEIESLGKGEVTKLESFLRLIMLHMLKWDYQSRYRGASWEKSVRSSQRHAAKHLKANPSLKSMLDAAIAESYQDARDEAAVETGFPEKYFPEVNPYTFATIMTRELKLMDPEL